MAEKVVDDNADEICKGLAAAAMDGHVMSAQFLVELADGNVNIEEASETGPLVTIAMRLGAERQLPKEHPDAEEEKAPSQAELVSV